MSEAKPYSISKHQVVEAYRQVKANRGAAGIDEQTITDFERKLKANLYKVWNRMTSGSYFSPPVRTVAIPKNSGGEGIEDLSRMFNPVIRGWVQGAEELRQGKSIRQPEARSRTFEKQSNSSMNI